MTLLGLGHSLLVVRSRMVAISSRVGIVDDQLEEEAVELRLGKRIGAFLLDRVLRRHDEERLLQFVDRAADGDAVLLHRFQQSRLRLGRGPVDFVGEHDLGEERTGLKAEDALAVGRFADDVGADDVRGIRSGVNWMRLNFKSSTWLSVRTSSVLPRPGTPSSSACPPTNRQVSTPSTIFCVADDDLADFFLYAAIRLAKLLGALRHR